MSQPWVYLLGRYGAETRSPTVSQIAEALTELYYETLSGMSEGDYAEHGAASVRYGHDEGPMLVLEINRLREVRFEEWADQDYYNQLAPARRMSEVPEDQAIRLAILLAQGEIERVRSQAWE